MLKRAQQQMPESAIEKSRFEIPKVVGHIEGNKTIITNFSQIANTLNRPADHLLKYVLKGLATPGEIRGQTVVFGTKLAASKINAKIRQYAQEFVLCHECGKPDTKIIKEGKLAFLRCTACGAKHALKGVV